eukprot:6180399-Pleurochrysis_carterae.AAC.2
MCTRKVQHRRGSNRASDVGAHVLAGVRVRMRTRMRARVRVRARVRAHFRRRMVHFIGRLVSLRMVVCLSARAVVRAGACVVREGRAAGCKRACAHPCTRARAYTSLIAPGCADRDPSAHAQARALESAAS